MQQPEVYGLQNLPLFPDGVDGSFSNPDMKIKHVQNPIRYFPLHCLGLSFPTAGITQLAPLCLGILAVKPAAYIGPAECAQGPKLLIEIILSSPTLLHSGSPNHGWLLKLYRQTE